MLGKNLADYRRNGDSPDDWGPVFQRAIDDQIDPNPSWPPESGGNLVVGEGRHTVVTPVIVRCPGILIEGCGGPNSFRCSLEWRNKDPDAAMFTFVAKDKPATSRSGGFQMKNIRVHGWDNPGVAFRFSPPEIYERPFNFKNVGIDYFGKGFEVLSLPGAKCVTWGGLNMTDCNLMYCGQAIDAGRGYGKSGVLNESTFIKCLFSYNCRKSNRYAFHFFGGSNILCVACVFENQERAILVERFQGFGLRGCRFENNATGDDPVCLFKECDNVSFQAHHYVTSAEDKPDAPPIAVFSDCENVDNKPIPGKVVIERPYTGRY